MLALVLGDTVGEGSWLIQLVVAVIGACLLIWVARLVKGRT
ncbi:MAG: GlsB/YeaQ/YmgE family stress response membrane protein [Jannaschia sp.]